jgi:hypothetical protein
VTGPSTTGSSGSAGTTGSSTSGAATTGGGRFGCDLGDGGLFGPPIQITTGINVAPSDSVDLAVGDLDGDGVLDIVEADYLTNDTCVLLGNGDGSFGDCIHIDAFRSPIDLLVTWTGRSAHPSLVVADDYGLTVAEVDGLGALTSETIDSGVFGPTAILAADFNGDGLMDFTGSGVGASGLEVYLANEDGGWAPGFLATAALQDGTWVGDFNGDGIPDIIALDNFLDVGAGVAVFLGNGDGTFAEAGIVTQTPAATGLATWRLGDLNEDGHLDLFVSGNGDVVLFGQGDGTFVVGPTLSLASFFGGNPSALPCWPEALHDMNGDGHLDYIGRDFPGNEVRVALGNGDGTFQTEMLFAIPDGGPSILVDAGYGVVVGVAIGDANGDGKPDLIAWDISKGDVAIFLNQCK